MREELHYRRREQSADVRLAALNVNADGTGQHQRKLHIFIQNQAGVLCIATSAPRCKTLTTTGKPFLHRQSLRDSLHSYRQSASAGLRLPVHTRFLTRLKNEESLSLILFVRESA